MKNLLLVVSIISTLQAFAQDKVAQLDSLFKTAHMKKVFFGNVLVAEKGNIVYQGSFGTADYATGQKLNSESIFELASVSKQFTAMGIMLLKKQGKLNYNDSLRSFFPELPYYGITVLHLLHHTSGLPDYMGLFMERWDTSKIATNKDVIELMAKHKPAIHFAPGEKWEYSNTGYALLASIIEKASGASFPEYLGRYIFEPLGMKRTMVYRRRFEKRAVDNYAFGYVYSEKQKEYVLPDQEPEVAKLVYCLDGIMGDGTVNSTTTDLLKWDRALYTDKLVSKEMMAEAFQPGKLNDGSETKYGFGWLLNDIKGIGKLVNHSGGWPGYNTMIERQLDQDRTIIILRNHSGEVQFLSKVRGILSGVRNEVASEIKLPATSLKQYVGEYELAPNFIIAITMENDKIFGQATGQERFELFAEKEDMFFLKVVEAKIKFGKNDNGEIKNLVLYQNGQEIPGTKIK